MYVSSRSHGCSASEATPRLGWTLSSLTPVSSTIVHSAQLHWLIHTPHSHHLQLRHFQSTGISRRTTALTSITLGQFALLWTSGTQTYTPYGLLLLDITSIRGSKLIPDLSSKALEEWTDSPDSTCLASFYLSFTLLSCMGLFVFWSTAMPCLGLCLLV